jgi:recombinational DNA repair protein RecR
MVIRNRSRFKAMHGLNLEEEMMDILAYEITQEIDRELIAAIDATVRGVSDTIPHGISCICTGC